MKTPNETREVWRLIGPVGSLAAAVAMFALMAAVVGVFNGWPVYETVGSLVVSVFCVSLSILANRAAMKANKATRIGAKP